jgi:hypothetical protein
MSLLDPIPIVIIQGNNYSGVSVNRRDDGSLLFSGSTTPAIHVNGEGNFVSGLRGGLVQEGNTPNFWAFLQNGLGTSTLWLTRIAVIPPVITTSAPPAPVETFPDLPGLDWDVHIDDEFRTLLYKSEAPGYESRIAQGPDPVTHIKIHYNVLRQNVNQTVTQPAVLTLTSPMSISATMNVDLSISNYQNGSPRWSVGDSTVIFCAGSQVYKLDPVLGTATSVFTAPDAGSLNLSNVVGANVLAFTADHIYLIDTVTCSLIQTWSVTTFAPLISFIQVTYDVGTHIAWVMANRTSVGVDVYKLDLVGLTFTRITFTGSVAGSMVINPVASTLDLVNGSTVQSISIPSGTIATGTSPGSTTGALAADPDGLFWTSDDFATDDGTPSYVFDATPSLVLTVGTFHFGFIPPGVPRAQGYAFANVVPTVIGPLVYPVIIGANELAIIRAFWRAQRGDALSFLLPLSKLTKNLADPTIRVRFEQGQADFSAFTYQLYELQELTFVTVAG